MEIFDSEKKMQKKENKKMKSCIESVNLRSCWWKLMDIKVGYFAIATYEYIHVICVVQMVECKMQLNDCG